MEGATRPTGKRWRARVGWLVAVVFAGLSMWLDFGAPVSLWGMLCVLAAAVHFRSRPWRERCLAVLLVAVCFASHLLTDMKLSGWEVYLFWPFGERGYGFQPIFALGHPLNTWLVWLFMILPWVIAIWKPVTPLEIISPRLDRIFLSAFRKKPWSCATCQKACNSVCDTCARPACSRHGRISWRFRITCPSCALK